jgi:4'-phosphopantetheinyl transferase
MPSRFDARPVNIGPGAAPRWVEVAPDVAAGTLEHGQVHLWLLPLQEAAPPRGGDHAATLAIQELERARRYRFPIDRDRFVRSRTLLRQILGAYVGVPPEGLVFDHGPAGKPSLVADGAGSAVEFNLSHSGGYAVLGVTRGHAIGVDVEVLRPVPDFEQIARSQFKPSEVDQLLALPPDRRLAGFFAGWTRKEAYSKAIGAGLSLALDHFEVSLDPDSPALIRSVGGSMAASASWSLWGFEAYEGVWVAVVVEGSSRSLCTYLR